MKKIIVLLSVIVSIATLSGCTKSQEATILPSSGPTGIHGCLGSAGYNWDEELGVCLHGWEIKSTNMTEQENNRRAIKLAVDYIGRQKYLTLLDFWPADCRGCYFLSFKKVVGDTEKIEVEIYNWEIKK